MELKAAVLDLDGTLVFEDMLDVVCEIEGKRAESAELNRRFRDGEMTGSESVIRRINLLKGVPVSAIEEKLQEQPYLRPGAKELIAYLRENRIKSVIQSRNMVPVLQYYQRILMTDHVIGTDPGTVDGIIQGIHANDLPYAKSDICRTFLDHQGISPQQAIAFGNDMGDKKVFELVGASIAVNPLGGVEKYATAVVYDDLSSAIPIIESLLTR
jgi:phosphoserine phosphatase